MPDPARSHGPPPIIDFNGLDTAVHGPIRLGILTSLQLDQTLDFMTLKRRLEVPDGSLNLHLRTLEETGYISSKKAFVGSSACVRSDLSNATRWPGLAQEVPGLHAATDRSCGRQG